MSRREPIHHITVRAVEAARFTIHAKLADGFVERRVASVSTGFERWMPAELKSMSAFRLTKTMQRQVDHTSDYWLVPARVQPIRSVFCVAVLGGSARVMVQFGLLWNISFNADTYYL